MKVEDGHTLQKMRWIIAIKENDPDKLNKESHSKVDKIFILDSTHEVK